MSITAAVPHFNGRKIAMSGDSKFKMSRERYDSLVEELHYLETVREKEVSELIKEARSFGDLSENSEYDEAKTEQGKLYSKIAEMKVLIENAEIIEKTEMDAGVVSLSAASRSATRTRRRTSSIRLSAPRRPTPCRAAFPTRALSAAPSSATASARPSPLKPRRRDALHRPRRGRTTEKAGI